MILKYCQLFLRTECYERIVSVYLLNMKICAYLLDMTLLVCLDFIVPEENFTHNCRRHHYRWKPASFDLNSVRTGMSIEQRGFFSVLHLLWHGSSVYNGHLQEPVTLTPITVNLAMELSLPVYDLGLSQFGFEHPTFRLRGKRSYRLRHRRGTTWQNKSVVSVYHLNITIYKSINPVYRLDMTI